MAFPPPPTSRLEWSNLGFKVREVNGHIESHFSRSTGRWSPLRFVTDPYIKLHGFAPALNYGQQAYEGLKAFRTPSDAAIHIFRPDRNAARMQHSSAFIAVPAVPIPLFLDAVKAAVALNAEFVPPHATGAAMYIRPQVYGSSAQLGLSAPDEYTFNVFVVPTGVYHGTHPVRALVLDDFDRAAPNGTGSAKVGGNYAPVLPWSDRAAGDGYGITLHLDSATRTVIDEFSTSAFIGVLLDDDAGAGAGAGAASAVTLVVPESRSAIQSVTADSITEIGRSFGWKVERRPVRYTDLPHFAEVMAAGTAAAVVPIRSITRRLDPASPDSISSAWDQGHARVSVDGKTEVVTFLDDSIQDGGPVCLKLLAQLRAIQLGKVKDENNWCVPVTAEDGAKATAGSNGSI